MSVAQPKSCGIVTLTTDFGTTDSYVGAMKGVILTRAPRAHLVDISHEIPPQDVERGATVLAEAAPFFPEGTVHLAVVDPGVGTARRAIAIAADRAFFVGPDNGLLSLAVGATLDSVRAFELTNPRFRLPSVSATFHGRDVFAPAAAHLATGGAIDELGEPCQGIVTLVLAEPMMRNREIEGRVVSVDRFGNLLTNIAATILGPNAYAAVGAIELGPIAATYANVPPGHSVVLVGSNGRIEIAVRDGSAVQRFGDSPVVIVRW